MSTVETGFEKTWILEQKKGAYRIQVEGQRAAKVIIRSDRAMLIPTAFKTDMAKASKFASGGLLTRQISIYAPSQYLLCSPSRDMPLSPISLPSPSLSFANVSTVTTPYYCLEPIGNLGSCNTKNSTNRQEEYRVIGKEDGKQQLMGDFKIRKEERGKWGKQKVWVDGRLLNAKGNEPLLMLSVALKVLEGTSNN